MNIEEVRRGLDQRSKKALRELLEEALTELETRETPAEAAQTTGQEPV